VKGYKNTTKTVYEPIEMAEGGVVDRRMIESTSARPRRVPLREEVPTPAERGAIQRGNRAAALEASESALLPPRVRRTAQEAPVIRKAAGGLAVKPVKKSLGGVMEAGLGYLTGGVPGLFGALTAQRLRKEQAEAAKLPVTVAAAAKPTDPTVKDPQQMSKGGRAKGVPVAPRAPMFGRK